MRYQCAKNMDYLLKQEQTFWPQFNPSRRESQSYKVEGKRKTWSDSEGKTRFINV